MNIIDILKKHLNSFELDYKQKQNNKLYEKDGLTEEVLNNQIEINKKRHELDIVDKTELTKSNEGFVQ